ncbi:MAG: hypothetical protein NDI69_17500 [Bacteriovoracaceae bacterium]|nr:hypothetical protein [Bacteriovoracaceae bacterium]
MIRKRSSFVILAFLLTTTAQATPLGLDSGKIKVISQNDELCTDGPYREIGEKGEEVLMVGTTITFSLPSDKKEIIAEASESECAEDVTSQIKDKTLTNITSTHHCPSSLKHLERTVTESLSVTGKRLKYVKESPKEKKIECVFEWSLHEKK